MCAAVMQQPIPLFHEGMRFWEDLVKECRRLTDAINRAALSGGATPEQLIRCDAERDLRMTKLGRPSTDVTVKLSFHSWGPVLLAEVCGEQSGGRKFTNAELEIPIARDLDGSVIAIFDEGRSFSAEDLTKFLAQNFRRCFPDVTLPC